MTDSILDSTKKILGLSVDYDAFDPDVIMHINSVFSILNQLGIGPDDGFMIEDSTATWDDFLGATPNLKQNSLKTYVCLRVRMLFDPPTTSYLQDAITRQIAELEFRLSVEREDREWINPMPIDQNGSGSSTETIAEVIAELTDDGSVDGIVDGQSFDLIYQNAKV